MFQIHCGEYTGHTVKKTYTWGMDLSGSMQGAGGFGGLLLVNEHSGATTASPPVQIVTRYYPTYDGNGNVSEYLDSTGVAVAHYEYDAFGNLTSQTYAGGFTVTSFAHKFCTKYHDPETGLYYYGYRFMDPVTGRWPSRDPIGERAGLNLYGFVGNDGINKWDFIGLDVLINAQQSANGNYVGIHANNGTSDLTFWVASMLDDEFSEPADPYEDTNMDPNGGPAGELLHEVDQPSWWPWSPDEPTEADQAADPDGGDILSIHISGQHHGNDFTVDIKAEPGAYILNVIESDGCVPPLRIDNSIHTRRTRRIPSAAWDYYTGGVGFN